jgi:hypothetical protein
MSQGCGGGLKCVSRNSLEINLNLHPRVIFKCNKCTLSMIIMARLTVLTELFLYDQPEKSTMERRTWEGR